MTLAAVITQLDNLSVSGVSNLGLDVLGGLYELPALVLDLDASRGGRDPGLVPGDVGLSTGLAVVYANHHLLVFTPGLIEVDSWSNVVTHADNYLAALVADQDLGGSLVEPLQIVSIRFGAIKLSDLFFGVTFVHRWVIRL